MAIDRDFELELEHIINKHSVDAEVGCPDYLLAESTMSYLLNLKRTFKERQGWIETSAPPLSP